MKVEINIVDNLHNEPPVKAYENDHGEVWYNYNKVDGKFNISLGGKSIDFPTTDDSLLILEPYCVSPSEYDLNFIKKFKYIFTWNPVFFSRFNIPVVEINCPSRNDLFSNKLYENTTKWSGRNNEIVFIANNKKSLHFSELYSLRIQLADLFYHNKNFEVSWYGNIPLNKPYYKGSASGKYEVLKNAKFCVCVENCYDPVFSHNYFTEKMPEALDGGAVPLYMGCYNIDNFNLTKNCYIDLRNYIKKIEQNYKTTIKGKKYSPNYKIGSNSLLSFLMQFDEKQYIEFQESIINSINSNKLYEIVSFSKMYDIMIDTFSNG